MIKTSGIGYQVLYNFQNTPAGPLVLSNNEYYGVTNSGGTYNLGMVFKLNMADTTLTDLHDFNGTYGQNPIQGVTIVGNELYGFANGGVNGLGVAYKLKTDGTGFVKLIDFDYVQYVNYDGAYPAGIPAVVGDSIYGMLQGGGINNLGFIFSYYTAYPEVQAKSITVTNNLGNQIDVNWTVGNGDKKVVFVKQGTGAITNPKG